MRLAFAILLAIAVVTGLGLGFGWLVTFGVVEPAVRGEHFAPAPH